MINILEQLEIDETKAKSDIAGLEQQLATRRNDLSEIQIAKKRCMPYLTNSKGINTESASLNLINPTSDAESPERRRRSLGGIKRKVLEGFYTRRDDFLTNQEVSTITGVELSRVKTVTMDSKKRNELITQVVDGQHKYQLTKHGISRIEESQKEDKAA